MTVLIVTCFLFERKLLPPASEGWGKVLFSVYLSVHTSTGGGGGSPARSGWLGGGSLARSGWWGYPSPLHGAVAPLDVIMRKLYSMTQAKQENVTNYAIRLESTLANIQGDHPAEAAWIDLDASKRDRLGLDGGGVPRPGLDGGEYPGQVWMVGGDTPP